MIVDSEYVDISADAVIPFDDRGRTRGVENAAKTPVAHFDEDRRAALDYLAKHPRVAHSKIGAIDFCIGGHLAFRAAFEPDVRATVCYYGTGIHDGRLGRIVTRDLSRVPPKFMGNS
jgi:carboxymethylenebutenolidase